MLSYSPRGFVVSHDGHVAQCSDEYQRIHGDVGDDVVMLSNNAVQFTLISLAGVLGNALEMTLTT